MRKVNKDFDNPPSALRQGFEEIKANLLEKKSAHSFDNRIYGHDIVKKELKELYHRKCAYCESFMSDNAFTIEHYRPKKGSYSYYWLGYEWSNLLPVCEKCNNAKGDKFPVKVPQRLVSDSSKKCRVKTPKLLPNGDLDIEAMKANHPYLLDEKPYLLHPEIDEPKEFLCVERNGELTFKIEEEVNKHDHNRALETIKVTKLNRDVLILQRQKIIDDFEYLLLSQTCEFLYSWVKEKPQNIIPIIRMAFFTVFKSIEKQIKEEQEYTLTAWCAWTNIETMLFMPICEKIYKNSQEIKELLNYALRLYKQSKDEE